LYLARNPSLLLASFHPVLRLDDHEINMETPSSMFEPDPTRLEAMSLPNPPSLNLARRPLSVHLYTST